MARAIDQSLLPQPKSPPRWKGLAFRFLFWIAAYAVVAVGLVCVLNVMQWR